MRPWARRAIAPYGPVAVPILVQVATRPGVIRPTCRAALLALGRLPYQRTVDALMKPLVQGGAMFRDDLIPVLLRLRERRSSLKFPRGAVEKALRLEVDESRQLMKLGELLGPVQDDPWDSMLQGSVNVARRKRWERIFQLMALRHDVRDIMGAWMRFTDDDRRRRADAEEFLENLLAPRLKLMLRGLLTVDPSWQKPDREQSLRGLLAMEDPWLRSCAISTIDLQDQPKFRDDLEQIRGEDSFLVSETAGMVLDAPRRSGTMLTTIEKAILLEKVDFFSAVAGEQMAGIAMIAEEMALGDGEVVYQAGEPSDAMYLVVDGFISLKRGDEEIARSEGGEAFGAWALFDMEPRIVSAVADGACRLLRIDREDFADLMAEDVHVAQSLIKSITSRLRQLAARVS